MMRDTEEEQSRRKANEEVASGAVDSNVNATTNLPVDAVLPLV